MFKKLYPSTRNGTFFLALNKEITLFRLKREMLPMNCEFFENSVFWRTLFNKYILLMFKIDLLPFCIAHYAVTQAVISCFSSTSRHNTLKFWAY